TEYSIASGSLLLNFKTNNWDDRILDTVGLSRENMPDIINSGMYASKISSSVCKELNIKPIRIATCASHDTASAVASIPVENKYINWAFLSTGTWFILGIETTQKIIKDDVIKYGFTNEGGVLGTTFLGKNLSAGLWVLQECRKKWNDSYKKSFTWEEIERQAKISKLQQVFIDLENATFIKSNRNMPELIADFCRNTNQPVPQKIGEISKCIFESLALIVKQYLFELEIISGKKIEILHMIGGGVYNQLLCQLVSNALGIIVLAGPAEAASAGNLIMQLKAGNDISDLSEGREIIKRSFKVVQYSPKEKVYWEESFNKFKELIKNI
ncbi:FGGY-family carbohydrate kinase, partial [Actinomycetota bacterium]